jgi:hypothetical protein
MSLPTLDVGKVFLVDAAEIVAAREKSILIHHTRDVDAAGDEVEQAVRAAFARRLPSRYYTGHGHIVDADLHTSPQLDIVVSDGHFTPTLFRGTSGTEYFPYESVYGFGEVKSTYDKYKDPVGSFVETIRRVRSGLKRKPAPPNYAGDGVFLAPPLSTGVKVAYQNPLFTFMFFVSGGKFALQDLAELYRRTPVRELPSVVCLLDVGLVVNCRVSPDGTRLEAYNRHPELLDESPLNRWYLLRFGSNEERIGSNLAFLYAMLLAHVQGVRLLRIEPDDYLSRLFIPTAEPLV